MRRRKADRTMRDAPYELTDKEAEIRAATSYVPRKSSRNGAVIFSIAVFAMTGAVVLGVALVATGGIGLAAIVAALLTALLVLSSTHIALSWEKVVVLRFGKLARVVGPGLYLTIPLIEHGTIRVDQRTIATPFYAEKTLTADLVPVTVDAVLFWQTMLLPALFALSSLSCGVACAFLGAAFVETRRPITRPLARLALVDGVLVVLEALVMAGYLAWAFAGEGTALAAQALVAGDLRWAFWGGAVLCGLAVPFALERCLTHGNSRTQLLWIAAALLAGGFALRFCLVGAGAYDATQLPGLLFGLTIG